MIGGVNLVSFEVGEDQIHKRQDESPEWDARNDAGAVRGPALLSSTGKIQII